MWLRRIDGVAQLVGMSAIVVGHGIRRSGIIPWEFGAIPLLAMIIISTAILVRYRWSLKRTSFARRHIATVAAGAIWIAGVVIVMIIGPALPDTNGSGPGGPRWWWIVHFSEIVLAIYSVFGVIRALRTFSSKGFNPAILLVFSFLVLIAIGTALLMLPACRNIPVGEQLQRAPFLTAFFTSASASCVTGLIIVDTPTYWSPLGQFIIMCLFQIGGLGIMTFSAFFAAIAGRNVRLSEFATLRDLLSSEGVGDIRKLIYAILAMTFIAEFVGTIMLFPMFADEPFSRQLFMSVFH